MQKINHVVPLDIFVLAEDVFEDVPGAEEEGVIIVGNGAVDELESL